jgi:probable HAF family extracellular repeat protein
MGVILRTTMAMVLVGGCTAPGSLDRDGGPTSASASPERAAVSDLPSATAECPPPQVRTVTPTSPGGLRYAARALEVDGFEALWSVAINEAGQVAGTARVGGAEGYDQVFRWDPDGRVAYLEAGGRDVMAQDINGLGQVAGGVWRGDGESIPFVWDERGRLREIGAASVLGTQVDDVILNDRGQLAGTMEVIDELWGSTGVAAFRVDSDGSLQEAPVANAQAVALNAHGDVLLTSELSDSSLSRLFVWGPGKDLRGGGRINSWTTPDLSDSGLVVGSFVVDDSDSELVCGFLWDSTTGEQTLIGLGADPSGINERGQVAGTWDTGVGRHAFLWDADHGMIDLGVPPGLNESSAIDVNDRGQVLGYGFVWDPDAGFAELAPLRAGESTLVDGITDTGIVGGVSGPLDPENGVIVEGQAAIWSPVG